MIRQPQHCKRFSNASYPAGREEDRGVPDRIVHHRGKSGIVLAVNLEWLVAKARRTDSIIEFVPQVGDFVAVDEPLFYLYGIVAQSMKGGSAPWSLSGRNAASSRTLCSRFASWSILR